MGRVYEGTDLQLRRKVAVKLILEDSIKDSVALDRFRREPHVLASFQHSNVVTLFDAGVTPGGYPFLMMETGGPNSSRGAQSQDKVGRRRSPLYREATVRRVVSPAPPLANSSRLETGEHLSV